MADQSTYLLRLLVIGVEEAFGKRVGTHQQAPLDLGAEPLGAGPLVEINQISRVVAAVTEAYAIVA